MTSGGNAQSDGELTAVERAVAWLTVHLDNCPRPIVPYIKQAYGLGNVEAVEAVRLASLKRSGSKNG
jgi:hypothetical protein